MFKCVNGPGLSIFNSVAVICGLGVLRVSAYRGAVVPSPLISVQTILCLALLNENAYRRRQGGRGWCSSFRGGGGSFVIGLLFHLFEDNAGWEVLVGVRVGW